jgi:hypothetical protein
MRVVRPLGGVIEPHVGWAVEPLGVVVGPPTSAMGVVRPPKGTVRPPAVVIGVTCTERVPMDESTRSISDNNS